MPRWLYGTEIININEQQRLEQFQVGLLKQLQWLPKSSANVATYLLLGLEPIELQIDKEILILYGQVVRDSNTLDYSIAERQIALYDANSRSWFSKLKKTLFKYNLRQAHTLLNDPPSKSVWKNQIENKTRQYWESKLITEKETKSSLKYLSTNSYKMRKCHQIWKFTHPNPIEVEKACIKARLLTGCYILQSNRAKCNQYEIDLTCPLCHDGPEDREHFLFKCSALNYPRDNHLQKIINTINHSSLNIQINSDNMIQLILD